jgi:hypothetical protein
MNNSLTIESRLHDFLGISQKHYLSTGKLDYDIIQGTGETMSL